MCSDCAPHNDGARTESPPRLRYYFRCGAEVERDPLAGDMSGDTVGLTLMHGSSKHKIEISAVQEGCEPTLQDMATVIAQVTGVPQQLQKLIFKGKSLKEMEQPLSVLGVKNGCKIMMIGKKNSPEEEAELKKLKELEKSTDQLSHKLEEINAELTGIQNGFLAQDLQSAALSKLEKKVKSTSEQCMKFLEQIDAMSLPDDFSDCRHKRKSLVKNVQNYLAQCDVIETNISQQLEKLQSKNLTLAD